MPLNCQFKWKQKLGFMNFYPNLFVLQFLDLRIILQGNNNQMVIDTFQSCLFVWQRDSPRIFKFKNSSKVLYINLGWMKRKIYCIFFIVVFSSVRVTTFDLTQIDKHGVVLRDNQCNKDTMIEFSFSPSSVISNCTTSGCVMTGANASTLQFLNVGGVQNVYTLQSGTALLTPGGVSRPDQKGVFLFVFKNEGHSVQVAVPFSNTDSAQAYSMNLDSSNLDSSLSFLSSATNQISNSSGVPLSAFNYLNLMQLGHFYQVADSSATDTYLLGYFVLSNFKVPLGSLPTLSGQYPPVSANVDYGGTSDKLCYGSVSQGIVLIYANKIVLTHLRQSYPLWTALIGISLYWIYYLTTDLITISCYDNKFKDNKWTCWSIYSLHNLGHEEYFSKLSRQTMMLVTFCWEALVLGILYSQIPEGQGDVMILWAAVIAVITALPFPFVLGYFFHSKIYSSSLRKLQVMKNMHGHFNKKDGINQLQKQLDDIEQHLYGLYYWFYVIAFVFFVSFWVITTHQMMYIHRDHYYLHRYWYAVCYYRLASLAVAFGLQHLFIDPLLTLLFGKFSFYQIRGYYYDFELGEKFKQLQI